MLTSAKDVLNYGIAASDGKLGSVHDIFFDDETWNVRYVVVDSGKWVSGRLVLISPGYVRQRDSESKLLSLSITREQVRSSPSVETDLPVARRKELQSLWAAAAASPKEVRDPASPSVRGDVSGDETHLRSCREVLGYVFQATDGELGHVEDCLFEDTSWAVRYLVVDTRNWWFGGRVVIPPGWVRTIDWCERTLHVDVSRDAVKNAPKYQTPEHVSRLWEADYYAHYQRRPYWEE